MAKDVSTKCKSHKDWWKRLSPEARALYFYNHPNTKMRKVAGIKTPLTIADVLKLQDERLRKRKTKWRAAKNPLVRG